MGKLNILVTGGGGFLGKAIVMRLLDEGHSVSSLGRSPQPELEAKGVSLYSGSMTDVDLVENATKGKDVVFHVAAKAGVWGSWDGFYKPNVLGTRNILKACEKNGVPHMVYTSTPSVVCNQGSFANQNERLPYGSNWLCHYAHTKAIAEKEALEANNKVKVIALRPHLIWGPGDPHFYPFILKHGRSGRLRQVGSGENYVDITHIDNAVQAHLLAWDALLQGHPGGKAYFISDGEPVNLWHWINTCLTSNQIPPVSKKVSYKTAYCVGACLEFFYKLLNLKNTPPMTRFLAQQLSKSHYFDISAARQDLQYKPRLISVASLAKV